MVKCVAIGHNLAHCDGPGRSKDDWDAPSFSSVGARPVTLASAIGGGASVVIAMDAAIAGFTIRSSSNSNSNSSIRTRTDRGNVVDVVVVAISLEVILIVDVNIDNVGDLLNVRTRKIIRNGICMAMHNVTSLNRIQQRVFDEGRAIMELDSLTFDDRPTLCHYEFDRA
mmetsp:Transcript_14456/g.39843  ORF Transcript_14456/g.39843 Transcript_14456/m.39843 type:complete len:169 (-) Transcript_14456:1550-2056(-)